MKDRMKASFKTSDLVCSSQIDIELEGDVIRSVCFTGGCHGNTQGVSRLVTGMNVYDAIDRLEGINCNGRGTSCPDQVAQALKQFKIENA